jgi:hypothetical protein
MPGLKSLRSSKNEKRGASPLAMHRVLFKVTVILGARPGRVAACNAATQSRDPFCPAAKGADYKLPGPGSAVHHAVKNSALHSVRGTSP